jgi:ATP-dependent DNA helicase RecQ
MNHYTNLINALTQWKCKNFVNLFRGADFRPAYKAVAYLRSIFTEVTLLGLSATVTPLVLEDILKTLQLDQSAVVVQSLPPDRPNIFLEIVTEVGMSVDNQLQWLIVDVGRQQRQCPKTLIFARTINAVSDIFMQLMYALGQRAFVDGVCDSDHRLVSMYHAHVSQQLQDYTLNEFSKPDSNIRVLVSTVAFGMGVEIRDIRHVIHWGPTSTLMAFWQEIGRAGRDGLPARATWYAFGKTDGDSEVFQSLKRRQCCARLTVLKAFALPDMDTTQFHTLNGRVSCNSSCVQCDCSLCMCCNYCRATCKCSSH